MSGSKNKAFTLVELLFVISIIGLMGAIFFVSVNRVAARTRDLKRMQDLKTIQKALEQYYVDHGYYPGTRTADAYPDKQHSLIFDSEQTPPYSDNAQFLEALKPYLPNNLVPLDPVNQSCWYPTSGGPCQATIDDWQYHLEYRYINYWWHPSSDPSQYQGTLAAGEAYCGDDPGTPGSNEAVGYYFLGARLEMIDSTDPLYESCLCPYNNQAQGGLDGHGYSLCGFVRNTCQGSECN